MLTKNLLATNLHYNTKQDILTKAEYFYFLFPRLWVWSKWHLYCTQQGILRFLQLWTTLRNSRTHFLWHNILMKFCKTWPVVTDFCPWLSACSADFNIQSPFKTFAEFSFPTGTRGLSLLQILFSALLFN